MKLRATLCVTGPLFFALLNQPQRKFRYKIACVRQTNIFPEKRKQLSSATPLTGRFCMYLLKWRQNARIRGYASYVRMAVCWRLACVLHFFRGEPQTDRLGVFAPAFCSRKAGFGATSTPGTHIDAREMSCGRRRSLGHK